jgi:hypothetical protein
MPDAWDPLQLRVRDAAREQGADERPNVEALRLDQVRVGP